MILGNLKLSLTYRIGNMKTEVANFILFGEKTPDSKFSLTGTYWTTIRMNANSIHEEFQEDELDMMKRDFWGSLSRINAVISTENTSHEVSVIEDDIETLSEIGETFQQQISQLSGDIVPSNPSDVDAAVAHKHNRSGIPKDEIKRILQEEMEKDDVQSIERGWIDTIDRLQQRGDEIEAQTPSTTVQDWK